MQFDRIANDVLDSEQSNLLRITWDRAYTSDPTSRGAFGFYQVRSNGVNPDQGFSVEGDIANTNVGLFIQDSWSVNDRLTLNLGLRTENESVPSYTTADGISPVAIKWGFGEKLAPRLGFAYDVAGDGKTKLYGNWGIYYDIFKLELPQGSFGGQKWLEYWYTLDTPNFESLDPAGCPPACPGRLLDGPIDFRHPSKSIGEETVDNGHQADEAAGTDVRLSSASSASTWRWAPATSTSRSTRRSRTSASSTTAATRSTPSATRASATPPTSCWRTARARPTSRRRSATTTPSS